MNTSFIRFVSTFVLASLSGCAIVYRLYVAPADGEMSFLRVADKFDNGLPGHNGIAIFEKADNCQGRYWMQGGPSNLQQTEVTTQFAKIRAAKPQSIAIHYRVETGTREYRFCTPIVNFTPAQGRYYRVMVGEVDSVCRVLLQSASDSSMRDAVTERFRKMEFSTGMDENSSFCRPSE